MCTELIDNGTSRLCKYLTLIETGVDRFLLSFLACHVLFFQSSVLLRWTTFKQNFTQHLSIVLMAEEHSCTISTRAVMFHVEER